MSTINTPDSTFATLKYDLSRYLPIRVVLSQSSEDGKYLGLTEESFSMGRSPTHVRIWWSGRAYSFLGEHILDGIKDAEHNLQPGDIIVDPLSEDCPVEIDWQRWITSTTKYDKRNAPFRVRGDE